MKIGAVPVPINTLASLDDLYYYLSDSRARAVVVGHEVVEKVAAVRERLPHLRQVVVVGEPTANAWSFGDLVAGQSVELQAADTHRDDPAYWLYSSGTTGLPKGVIHRHEDMVHCTGLRPARRRAIRAGRHLLGLQAVFLVWPGESLYLPLWAGGAVVLIPIGPDATTILATIERYRPTLFFSVPTSYAQVIREWEARAEKPDLSSLRLCVRRGDRSRRHLRALARANRRRDPRRHRRPRRSATSSSPMLPGVSPPGSSGQLIPGDQARLVEEDGTAVPTGDVGDLWIRAPEYRGALLEPAPAQ